MKDFTWVFRHYFKRSLLDVANLLNIGLPILFAFAFQLIINFQTADGAEAFVELNGLLILMVLGFQFFGAGVTTGFLHNDLKGAVRSRLLASGVAAWVFSLGVVMASWVFNIAQGIVLILFTTFVLDAHWEHPVLMLVALSLMALMAQMCGVLIFKHTKDKKAGSKMSYFFGEGMLMLAILPVFIDALAPVGPYLPVGLGIRVVEEGSLTAVAILAAQVAVVAMVALLTRKETSNA